MGCGTSHQQELVPKASFRAASRVTAGGSPSEREERPASIFSSSTLSPLSPNSSSNYVPGSNRSDVGPFLTPRQSFDTNGNKDSTLEADLEVEQGVFTYDDIVISKDEARTRQWMLAGRRPSLRIGPTLGSRRGPSPPPSAFSFTDFNVCVDEVDMMPQYLRSDAGPGEALDLDVVESGSGAGTTVKLPASRSPRKTPSAATVSPTTDAHLEFSPGWGFPATRTLQSFTVQPLLGHATRVKCIAIAPTEKTFASNSSEQASLTLSNLLTGEENGIFTGHEDIIISAAFSPDGCYLATTSKDRTMILWDSMTTQQLLTFGHAKVVIGCCFSPDSRQLVSGCQDRICRVWDTKRGRELVTYCEHSGIIISIAYSPVEPLVCSASADKTVRVWSGKTGETRFVLQGHTGIILACSYSTDGKYIISNDDQLLRVWSAADGSCIQSLRPHDVVRGDELGKRGLKLGWTLSCAAPGPFSRYLLVGSNNKYLYVLDILTGEVEVSTSFKAPIYCLTSGFSTRAACGDSYGNIYVISLA